MSRRYWGPFALLCALSIGCNTPVIENEYSEVTGVVTIEGKPLTAGKVLFQPESGPFATGEIQPDGSYHLKAQVGPNVIMVVPVEKPDPDGSQARKSKSVAKSIIPEQYSSPKSTLKFDVSVGDNQADFDLK